MFSSQVSIVNQHVFDHSIIPFFQHTSITQFFISHWYPAKKRHLASQPNASHRRYEFPSEMPVFQETSIYAISCNICAILPWISQRKSATYRNTGTHASWISYILPRTSHPKSRISRYERQTYNNHSVGLKLCLTERHPPTGITRDSISLNGCLDRDYFWKPWKRVYILLISCSLSW